MALDFRPVGIHFDVTSGIIQRETGTAVFGGPVKRAIASLNGFNVFYANGDHPTRRQFVDLKVSEINNNTVTVEASLLLRDGSGNIDDPFGGDVDVVVLAEV
jgi:hypothetical protein